MSKVDGIISKAWISDAGRDRCAMRVHSPSFAPTSKMTYGASLAIMACSPLVSGL